MVQNYRDLSDIELFIKIEKYDPRAIEEVYQRYAPVLFPLIVRIANNPQAAENILIDVFISLWRKIDLFNFERGNTYTWLVTLARNKAVRFLRQKRTKNNEDFVGEDEYEDFYIMPDLDKKIESLDLATALKRKTTVEKAVNKLTEAQKYVLFLSYYDGFTINDISDKLNIPLTTIRSKITISLHYLMDNLLSTSTKILENNDLNEMITAYAVGCMDEENYSYFKKHKQMGEYLPEGMLGKLQVTISFLPITLRSITIAENLKERFGRELLETHKDIMNNIIIDRRKQKFVEEQTNNVQPVEFPTQNEVAEEEKSVEYEPEKKEVSENSRSKLFWFFNFILIGALILFSYLLSDKTSQLNEDVELMKRQLNKIKSESTSAKDFINEHTEFIDFFNNPNIIIIPLIGSNENPNSFGRLFISIDAGEGLLEANNLPELQTDQFYSLWMNSKMTNIRLNSFKIVPGQKYIKFTQIPYTTVENMALFRITKEAEATVNKPSEKTYLFGAVPGTKRK